MLGNNLSQTMSIKQTISNSQVQSLNILSMANYELQEFLEKEYQENPLLEISRHLIKTSNENNMDKIIDKDSNENLKNDLKNQIPLNRFSSIEMRIILYVIEMIDEETGYLTVNEEEINNKFHSIDNNTIKKCLKFVRSLEPYGIGYFTIEESLIGQAQIKNILDKNLEMIISENLEDLAKGRIGKISKKLSITVDEVRNYIKLIQSLNPRPVLSYEKGLPQYIVPDVVVHFDDGSWEAELNDNWTGSLEINSYYEKMANEAKDESLAEYFNEKLTRAKFIVKSIEQRRSTLLKVTGCILKKQDGFLFFQKPLKPMILEDLANELNIHVSTVSRTIKNKFLQTPRGTYPFKYFLSESVSKSVFDNGDDYSARNIKEIIREIIDSEPSEKPYSDEKIACILNGKKINISRRTVAKYREELNIPSTINRKK